MKKIIEIQDYNDTKELKHVITKLQKRRKDILRSLGFDQIYFNGSKYNIDSILPAFNEMYDVNLDNLYENKNLNKDYYIYFHCNPLIPLNVTNNIKHLFLASKFPNLRYEPFYVGKGVGDRYNQLNRNDTHRKIRSQIKKFNLEIVPIKVKENLTECEALTKESILIDILGLKSICKDGLLVNLDEGESKNIRHQKYNDCNNSKIIKKILNKNGFK